MKILKIFRLILLWVPDFIQSLLYNIFYYLFSKREFKKKIEISPKKGTNSKNNLVVMDNMKALGDFFVFLNIMVSLDNKKSDYKYVIVINKIYEKIVEIQNFKNLSFIFLSSDFGTHYDREKINKKDIYKISNNISNQIEKCNKNWNNVYVCAGWLDLTHYSILSKINYNNAYCLKHISTKYKPRIIMQNLPIPSIPLWLYFFHFYKKLNIKIWNLKSKEAYYFGKMSYDMIRKYDNSLSQYITNNKKRFNEKKENLNNISVMLKTSNNCKNIDLKKFIKLLCNLNLNKNTNIYFLGKDYYDIPFIKDLNIINLTGKTSNLMDLLEHVNKSQLIFTADTSLYHIASFLNISAIVFVNSRISKINRSISFWLNNYKNNLIIKNDIFFKYSLAKKGKEFNNISTLIKKFINENFETK